MTQAYNPKYKEKYLNIVATNAKTGEVLDRLPVYCPKKVKSFFSDEGFLFVANNALVMLSDSDLDGVTIKVLLRLISTMEMENLIAVNQSELAEMMGIAKSQFSRSMKTLIEHEIILENPNKVGRFKTYQLNPKYAWRGSTKNHIEAIESYEDDRARNTKVSKVIETDAVTVTTTVTTTVESKIPVGNSSN